MIPGWPDSALEPGRTRIQHLDLETRIVRLPARIDRIARRLLEAAFARHNELHNGTGEMQPDHT